MLRTFFALLSMGTAVAIFSCSGAKLGGSGEDASMNSGGDGGIDAPADACAGLLVIAQCTRFCDGTFRAVPSSGVCPPDQFYERPACLAPSTDGMGPPKPNSCGADGGCTTLANDAPSSPVRFHSGEGPADALGAGGVIADGVYDLVSTDVYRSSDSSSPSRIVNTIRVSNSGTQIEQVWGYEGTNQIVASWAATLAVSGPQVTVMETCRLNDWLRPPTTEEYTATPTALMLSTPTQVVRYSRR